MTIPHPEGPSPLSGIHFCFPAILHPGPRFWFIPLASGRSNPVSRQQSLRIPDFRRYFSSQIPDPEMRVPFERTKTSEEKHKQRNNQSKATYTNFYLFIFLNCFSWSLLDRPQVCHANLLTKNVTSLNYSAKMSFTVYHVTAGNSKTLESVNAYFSFHRHWFSLQWDVADKTIRYFLPNSDLFYLPVVRTDKCWGKKNIQRVSLISTSFDLELATYAENW